MKKGLMILAALLVIASGIMAVGAYEGHLVDVKAHVENAIGVSTYEVNMGTVFPQEVIERDIQWGLSNSFLAQNRLSSVDYSLYWELKPLADNAGPAYEGEYYQPLNPFLEVGGPTDVDIDDVAVKTIPAPGQAVEFASGTLYQLIPSTPRDGNLCDYVHLSFSVPVFEGYYNAITDPAVAPKNWEYGMLTAGSFNTTTEHICSFDAPVPNADLGIDLKIQVTGYEAHVTSP